MCMLCALIEIVLANAISRWEKRLLAGESMDVWHVSLKCDFWI